MNIDEEFLSKIETMGAIGYPARKIVSILNITEATEFYNLFYDKNSLVAKRYQNGVDKAEYAIDKALYEAAITGDLRAIEEYQKKKNQYNNIKEDEKRRLDKV